MIASLVRMEAVMMLRERRIAGALATAAVLVLLAWAWACAGLLREDAVKREVADAERARWLSQEAKDPHSAAHYSIHAFKPSLPLAALDPGIEPFVGQSVWLEAHHQNDPLYRPQADASRLQRAGLPNPGALWLLLAPLLAFLLAHAAVSAARERGSWRLVLAGAASPLRMLAAKAIAAWTLASGALVLPAFLAMTAVVAVRGDWDADTFVRAGGWLAVALSYVAIVVLVGMAVVARIRATRLAVAGLFVAWAVVFVAVPRWASDDAIRALPLPSGQDVRAQLLAEAPAYWLADEAKTRRAELLHRHGVDKVEALPVDLRGAELDAAERDSHGVFDRVIGGYQQRMAEQDRHFRRWAALSPAIAAGALSQAFAGTDFGHHRAFVVAAESYRRALVNRMNAEVMAHAGDAPGGRYQADASLWRQIPDFAHRPPRIADGGVIDPVALSAIAAWLALALAIFLWSARRVRP
jgi:ABC-2 type transport system permease protein